MNTIDAHIDTDIVYVTINVNNVDQTTSLSEYLTQHGVTSHIEGADAVVVPIVDGVETFEKLLQLRSTWRSYWDHCMSELHGLPLYRKAPCDHHTV